MYDEDGAWAESGEVINALLAKLLMLPFFNRPPPKSAGRELFNLGWLENCLAGDESAADVQATLLQLTVTAIAESVSAYFPNASELYLCGGGARNRAVVARMRAAMPGRKVELTDRLGVNADWLEAFAFAWLAKQAVHGIPGSLPEVTGAKGARVLGAIYTA
jgi:anhydro-N-acetylmuramic acid kinase